MIRPLKSLLGFKINAIDGEIGKIIDFYFDNITYTIRYLVVETGSLFFSRQILLSTEALVPSDLEEKEFMTNLTIQQIENCPHADTKKIISDLGEEFRVQQYYKWNHYRDTLYSEIESTIFKKSSAVLLSVTEISDLEVLCINSKVGHVRDFLIDEESWKVTFLILDAFNVSPAKEVVIPTFLISQLNPASATLLLNLSSEAIANSPEYFSDQLIYL